MGGVELCGKPPLEPGAARVSEREILGVEKVDFLQRLGPGVGCQHAESARETLGHLRLHPVVRRRAHRNLVQDHARVLRKRYE